MKRTFDLIFSLFILILLFPLLLLIAFLIALTSKGPIIYGHQRLGRHGKLFKCYKFRTMYMDADQRLKVLLAAHPEWKEEWQKTQKLKNDPRVTSLGSFLRKSSLDEMPQFFNVLKGDLSVVGPRPVVEEELRRHFGAKAEKILSVRPGITGIWQTSGRSGTTYAERIALDEKYVEQQSFWLDIKVILKTIPCMLFSKGAY